MLEGICLDILVLIVQQGQRAGYQVSFCQRGQQNRVASSPALVVTAGTAILAEMYCIEVNDVNRAIEEGELTFEVCTCISVDGGPARKLT
jgi:hypothetical protein